MIDFQTYSSSLDSDVENGVPARVTAVHKERYELALEGGSVSANGFAAVNGPVSGRGGSVTVYGRLKTAAYYGGGGVFQDFPTVGDYVLIEYNGSGDSRILKTLPRKTFFSRRDPTPGRGEQAVAANFDTVFVMASLNHDLNLKRLERYLTLSWQSGAMPVILLTKADLAGDAAAPLAEAVREIAMGVDVLSVSAVSGYGLECLSPYLLSGKTVVFLGSSGVGKSSLVNALMGERLMEVKEIREDDSRGRHTTTHRQLITLPSGAFVIDTPGMRELGMWDVSAGLGEAFGDVEAYFGKCRFSDCRHEKEPGCAVKRAIAAGELSGERWNSYLNLKREAKYSDDKAGFMRERQQWAKSIAKWSKQNKKANGAK
ncbi:MAG: ribosome small subunit-dependent GTPase A [Clostridiales bacterium]|jgi:ribosome biogenesis GTPase|nr:ribosome small subunit-dependent GTPase A [Clostridiales bacterium]